MATSNSVLDELFSIIGERYDMKMFIKAACSRLVIFREELQQLLRYEDETEKICAKLKKLLISDADRLTAFVRFTQDYSHSICKAAHKALDHLNNRLPSDSSDAEFSSPHGQCTRGELMFVSESSQALMIHQELCSSGSNSPLSPMDFDSYYKVNNCNGLFMQHCSCILVLVEGANKLLLSDVYNRIKLEYIYIYACTKGRSIP